MDTAAAEKTKDSFLRRRRRGVCRWHAAHAPASVPSGAIMRGACSCLIVLAAAISGVSRAGAQPTAAPDQVIAVPGTSPAPPEGEPHADRVVLAPTAYTHPRGTFFVSSYDVVVLQLGYALSDRTQVSVTATPPLGRPGEVRLALLDATLKTALVRQGRVRAAALGSVSGVASNDPGLVLAGRAGAVVQLCLALPCTSSVSVSSNVLLLGPVLLMGNGLGAIMRAGPHLSFVAEADTLVPLGREAGAANGLLAGGGLRLHWTRFALDFSLLRAVGGARATVPVLAATYRTAAW
jgi:hypothetical protein